MNPELRFKNENGKDFLDWEECELCKLAQMNPKSNLPQEFEYVDLESVVGTSMMSHRTENINSAPSRAQRVAQKGDLFYQTVRPYQKNNYLFMLDEDNYVFSTGYAQLRPNCNGYYLLSLVQQDSFVKDVMENCTGTSYPAINSGKLAKIEVTSSFSKEEQDKIGNTIHLIDEKIKAQGILVEKLKNTKDAMLVKMFPQGDSKVPEIRFDGFSGDWEKHNIQWLINNSIIENPMDGNHGEKHPVASEYVKDGIPFLMASDIKDGKVDLDNCKFITKLRAEKLDKGFAKNGDVLITHKATIGEVAILDELITDYAMLTPQVTYYRIIDEKKLNCDYLYSVFISNAFQKNIKVAAAQSTRAYIGIVKQHKLEIWYPNIIEEQEKIGQFFLDLDKKIELNQKKYDKLCDVKKALLSKLFPTKEDE